jgi:hypothetical protein
MIIMVSGPYSAATDEKKKLNLEKMNQAAAGLVKLGHVPVIGVNAALPVAEKFAEGERYKVIMDISLALVKCCEALLLIAESPGANKERDLALQLGMKVFYSLEELKQA